MKDHDRALNRKMEWRKRGCGSNSQVLMGNSVVASQDIKKDTKDSTHSLEWLPLSLSNMHTYAPIT